MKILGFEKISLVDFDEHVGCTIFLGGCNFRCPFCHNFPLVLQKIENSIPFEEIKSYLLSRKGKIDAVCVTGGEPTLSNDLPEMLAEIKKMGFFVKLDTNGTNYDMLKLLIDQNIIDYVAMDIKNDFDNYEEVIGKKFDLTNVKKSIEYLKKSNIDFEFRTTLIDEYHNEQNMIKIIEIIKGCKKYVLQKFTLRDTCPEQNLHEVSLDKAQYYLRILRENGINASLRGY